MGGFLNELRVHFSFDFHLNLFLDLYDNVSIDCLSLINRSVLVELQDYGDLCLVCHGKDKTFGDIFVIHDVVEGHTVKSDALLIKVNCVFASGYCQIDIQKCRNGLSCEFSNLGSLYNVPVYLLGSAFFCFRLSFLIHLFFLLLFFLPGLLDMKPDLAEAVFVAQIIGCGFDDDIVLVDG